MKAPYVTSLRIDKLSANNVHIKWDDVGSNFYYFVEFATTRSVEGDVLEESEYQWIQVGYTAENNWFDSNLRPESYYKMRVRVTAEGFDPSEWQYTEEFLTFAENAYTFETMNELSLAKMFIKEKFSKSNNNFIDFNRDGVVASLMNESFQFNGNYELKSAVSNFILSEDEYHEIQGSIEKICKDKERICLMESEGVLYLFERYQTIVKVSNDKGQTWKAINLLNDRVGNPVSRNVYYQTRNTTYLLGYDRVFYGRKSNDIRWSSDEVRFSSEDITFTKLGDQLKLGFDVEIFGTYSRLPPEISRKAEAITATDDLIYVVARDKVRYVKTQQAPIDTNPTSPTFGEKLFEPGTINITGSEKAVCSNLVALDGNVFALIIGEVKTLGLDPTVRSNIVDSNLKGIYKLQGDSFVRVFGNTAEERRRIEPAYSSLSTDGMDVFMSSSNYKATDSEIIQDVDTAIKYGLTDAVRYAFDWQFLHDKHYHMMSFRATKDDGYATFTPGRMRYYGEPFFNWSRKSKTRCWINTSNRVVVVYSDVVHEYHVDTNGIQDPERILHENWNKGTCTVTIPNIEFNGFTRYASGVLFSKAGTGEILGFYEFNYRVRDQVRIIWKPEEVFLVGYLQNQEHPKVWSPEVTNKERDPDLKPLLNKMIPDSYLLEESNFERFCELYLQYISDGAGTHYNNLLNLIRNKYPREKDSWEYLWSEIYKRNIYLNKDKRDEVSRFFEARKSDFYSTKGTEASYKFLFKVLYNEEVEIDIESKNTTEYDIIINSDNISEDLVGRTIYTATGRCNVTYIERDYNDGALQWRVTIHNLLGRIIVGQEVKAERFPEFDGMVVQGVRGKDLLHNNIDYINRSRSYYVMKIKSVLPTSRYRDDVIRFVHPVGFGFIGITLLTMFINSGLSLKHVQTIINTLKNYRMDAGLPSKWPDRVSRLDINGNQYFDPVTGEAVYDPHPNAGQDFPLRSGYNSENNNSIFQGQNPDQRRKYLSPTFDNTAVGLSHFRNLIDKRLFDDAQLPRNPEVTQVKIDE
ncbi:baseplate wedge subunit [Pseudomonas phage PspYZU05]|uniref:Baseplate wedge protein gp7 n=1 Tax=Pseudomonas phage PspYZU05 TaxID=1983556 RepID=A0A2U7NN17_9CAUD|nr:baseplate wedge subunit [Pseudomonas phage PspYZU05]ASD52067.1 baseplate wedge initiator [Pseudomonas phage PspYZU05]